MPKVEKPKLYDMEILELYDYSKTRSEVLNYFAKYRTYVIKIESLRNVYRCPLGNDNMGIFSSGKCDPTSDAATKTTEYSNYIDFMNKKLKTLRLRLTDDEKVIFNYSILSKHTDEELADRLALEKSSIYHRKKSCFIKVAQYFRIEVLK